MEYSVVDEIMTENSETEIKYLQDSINNVTEKVDLLKLNVKEKMEQKYVQFIPFVLENEVIVQNTNELVEDIKALQERLDTQVKKNVEDFAEELKKLQEELIESSTIVENTSMLSKINYHLEEAQKKNRPYDTAKHVHSACKYLNECKVLEFLDIYKSLTKTVTNYKVEYCKEAISEWNKHIQWIHIEGNIKSKRIHTSLCVSSDKNNIENLLNTLELYEVSDRQFASFGDNFMKLFLTLIIKYDCSLSHKQTRMSADELIIYSSYDSQKEYTRVLENLIIAFEFLNNVLGVQMQEGSFLSNLGEYIADDFLSSLIDDCLTNIVPLKKEDLGGYETIIDPIINFQTFLQNIGFIPKTNTLLKDYFGKIEKLFIKKAMEKYTGRAQNLMKRDLHELLQVGDVPTPEKQTTSKTEQSAMETIDYENISIALNKFSPNLFMFPQCCVSKSIQEFISLIHEILDEGLNSDADLCAKYFFMTRTIISLYSEAVPMYNAKLLYDIPQYSALLHNNLLYLAHQILILDFDKKFHIDSPETGGKLPINCFADLIPSLRKVAVKILSDQISRQEKIFVNMIWESGLSALSEYEELPECTEKSIKVCLRQLGLLKAVWENVLPIKIYCDAIGGLCNIIIEEITSRIVATSDIRADIATSLVKVLSHIEVEVPLLFPDSGDVILHLKSWSKLKELILVLGASLAEVGERWADGKGPLAAEFSADQVRQMVKALFQMSERRAAVLSRIK